MAELINVRIDRMVYGGDGMGSLPDGRTVFVPFVMADELVQVRLVEEKKRFVRGCVVEILEASPQRVTPRCIHFGYCGGCHYQHMTYAGQLETKTAILKEQLMRIGGFAAVPTVEILAAAEPWYYRNHIQFHLTREGKLGFQRAGSNHTFAIRECHLPEPSISLTWPQLDIEPLPSLERISMRVGKDDDLLLILECAEPQALDFQIEEIPISVVQKSPLGSLVLAGSDPISMEVLGREFLVSSGSFFQVNTRQAEAMVRYILDHLALEKTQTLVDVYCGVGLFSYFLASWVKNLVGIELAPEACEDFTVNLEEYENVSLYEATAEQVLKSVHFDAEVIIADPPREGLGVEVIEGILSQGSARLVYVSCDPATLGRDAKQLVSGGYQLKRIAMIDMFPQTYHLESISFWERV